MDASTVYDVTIFGLGLKVKPVAFTIPIGGGWDIYWYGIIISLGFLAALLYGFKMAKKFDIDVDRMIDAILVATPVAIICARLYYVIFSGMKISSFADIISIHNGGLAIYGGVIGAFVSGAVMCKWRKINILSMFDLASIGFLLAQGIGRWGNFVNQEAYGKATGSSWWGMTSDKIYSETYSNDLVHPCFLYESVWCILGFVALHFYSKHRKFKGEIFLAYCAWYGLGRFFIEGLRTDSLFIGSLRVSQLLAALAFIVGVTLLLLFRSKAVQKEQNALSYAPIFGEPEPEQAPEQENAAASDETGETTDIPEIQPSENDTDSQAESTDDSPQPVDQAFEEDENDENH